MGDFLYNGAMMEVEREGSQEKLLADSAQCEEGLYGRLLAELRRDLPDLRFRVGRKFAFRPPRTIFYVNTENGQGEQNWDFGEQKMWRMRILHEVGHAVLGHRDFATDVERLKMERAAWEKARELYGYYQGRFEAQKQFGVGEQDWGEWEEEVVEMELDSYRDWLHQRSKCPECGLTRYQATDGRYHCPRCEQFCWA